MFHFLEIRVKTKDGSIYEIKNVDSKSYIRFYDKSDEYYRLTSFSGIQIGLTMRGTCYSEKPFWGRKFEDKFETEPVVDISVRFNRRFVEYG